MCSDSNAVTESSPKTALQRGRDLSLLQYVSQDTLLVAEGDQVCQGPGLVGPRQSS